MKSKSYFAGSNFFLTAIEFLDFFFCSKIDFPLINSILSRMKGFRQKYDAFPGTDPWKDWWIDAYSQ